MKRGIIMKRYAIQSSESYEDHYNVVDNEELTIIETFSNIQDAKNYLIKLEQMEYLKEHEGMCFLYKYNKRRFNLHCLSDGYYMDCIDFNDEGKSLSCTQNYKLTKGLPTENSYTLLSDTCEKQLIEKTIVEKTELLKKWEKLEGMKNQYLQLLKEVDMLHDALLKL